MIVESLIYIDSAFPPIYYNWECKIYIHIFIWLSTIWLQKANYTSKGGFIPFICLWKATLCHPYDTTCILEAKYTCVSFYCHLFDYGDKIYSSFFSHFTIYEQSLNMIADQPITFIYIVSKVVIKITNDSETWTDIRSRRSHIGMCFD